MEIPSNIPRPNIKDESEETIGAIQASIMENRLSDLKELEKKRQLNVEERNELNFLKEQIEQIASKYKKWTTSVGKQEETDLNKPDEVPEDYCCPITYEIMKDPVIAADGQNYERSEIERWLVNNNTSPKTGAILLHKFLIPNYEFRNRVNEFKKKFEEKIAHKNSKDMDLFLRAAEQGDEDTIGNLILNKKITNINTRGGIFNRTALYYAASSGHKNIVKLLLENGASVNEGGEQNTTPLHVACKNNYIEVVVLLLNKNANPKSKDSQLGLTPLHQAIWYGHYEVVKLVLDFCPELINEPNFFNWTPLHQAASSHQADVRSQRKIITFLLKKGADTKILTQGSGPQANKTAVELAIESGHFDIADYILNERRDVRIKEMEQQIGELQQKVQHLTQQLLQRNPQNNGNEPDSKGPSFFGMHKN